MRVGVLCSRIRVEEKLLFEALTARGVEYEKLDDRLLVFDLNDPDVLRIAPFTQIGTPLQLVRQFGSPAAFEAAVLVKWQIVVEDVRTGQVQCEAKLAIDCLVRAVDARLIALHTALDDGAFLIEEVQRGTIGRRR